MNVDFSGDRRWWAVAVIAVLALVLAVAGDSATALLRYEREPLMSGELWRLVTGHLVHLGFRHLLLNLAGLLLVAFLVLDEFSGREWAYVTLWGLFAIGLGFVWQRPDLDWYVGLSGMLHCWLTAGALRRLYAGHVDGLVLLAAVILKGLYEQLVGPLPGSESLSGGDVVVDAHWYGMLGGLMAAWTVRMKQRFGRGV